MTVNHGRSCEFPGARVRILQPGEPWAGLPAAIQKIYWQILQNPAFAGIPVRAGFASNDTIIISCGKDDAVDPHVRFS
nr:hypothetical protein [uncultured Methanoregula sp.]